MTNTVVPQKQVTQVLQILLTAGEALRALIEREVSVGNFREVAEAARLAEGLTVLIGSEYPGMRTDPNTPAGTSHTGLAEKPAGAHAVAENPPQVGREPREAGHGTRKYPRFARQGDKLVKIGWSKKDRRPYEHKAPSELIEVVREQLLKHAKAKGDFGMDQVLPMLDAAGRDVPSYQAYLVLAWFRALGLVEKMGKDGYRLDRGGLVDSKLRAEWNALTKKES